MYKVYISLKFFAQRSVKTPGNVRNVVFKDIDLRGVTGNALVSLKGSDSKHTIENVTFDNVTRYGQRLTSTSTNLTIGPYTRNITFPVTDAVTYTVTYNANGATSGTAPATQTKTQDVPLTLATNTGNLAKTGFTFAGWNTDAKLKGTNYAAGATYTVNAAVTLYAKWILNTYTVTYNANGATSGTAPNSQTKYWNGSFPLAANTGNTVDLVYNNIKTTAIGYDLPASTVKINDTELYFWIENGEWAFKKFRGTLADPFKTLIWEGSSLKAGYTNHWTFPAGYPTANVGRFRPWLGNIHKINDTEYIGFVHIETSNWDDVSNITFRLGIGYSSDAGDHWYYVGDALRAQAQGDLNGKHYYVNMGGCPVIVVGEYFYQYFNDGYFESGTLVLQRYLVGPQ